MELMTVDIPRTGARERAAEYRQAAKRSSDPVAKREFEDIARAYLTAAKDNVQLIALTPTIEAGGTVTRTRLFQSGRRDNYLLPALAVIRWDARFCFSLGVEPNGHIEFIDKMGSDQRYRKGRTRLETSFSLPTGYIEGRATNWTNSAWSAMVPIIPPKHRPLRGMGDRLVLWEVEDWTWATVPAPPGDPALLRNVGGDIYAVEAQWDLTEVERMVLSGRRMEV